MQLFRLICPTFGSKLFFVFLCVKLLTKNICCFAVVYIEILYVYKNYVFERK